jgi:hypothetical protein
MKNTTTYLLPITLLIISSCNKQTTLTYKIKNMSYDHIRVVCANDLGSTPSDTIFINYNETKTIAVNVKGSEKVYTYKETDAQLHDFKKMDIYRYDSIPKNTTRTNFLQSKLWVYTEHGAHAADYTAIVTSNDF